MLKRKLALKATGKKVAGRSRKEAAARPVKKAKTQAASTKAVSVDALSWTPVDVSEKIDDFEGFYGLEEVDGVGIDFSGGNVKFKISDYQKPAVVDEQVAEDIPLTAPSTSDEEAVEELTKSSEAEPTKAKNPKKKTKSKKTKSTKLSNQKSTESAEENPFAQLANEPEELSPEMNWNMDGTSLSPGILRALSSMKFYNPTEIQAKAIPEILGGSDLIGKAATGSGKTLAYALPIIEKHIALSSTVKSAEGDEIAKKWPTGLIFSPTRELAHQICKHIQQVWAHCGLSGSGVVPITGGLAVQKQKRLLKHDPAFVVATPGRFLEILKEGKTATLELFSKCEFLVLDEADRLIQDGHFEEMEKILDIIGRGRQTKRQTLVFSATFRRELMQKLTSKNKKASADGLASQKDVLRVLNQKLEFKDKEPIFIDSNPAEAVARQVVETIMECGAMEKDLYLYYFLLQYSSRSIVFVNSIDSVKRLVPLLKELNIEAFGLHSDMIQKQRLRSLERFRDNDLSNGGVVLVATDVAARGLDIPAVQHVIHYHLPRSADMYIHRSGRTARAGNEGLSLILCSPDEASGPLVKLKNALNRDNAAGSSAMRTFEVEFEVLSRIKPRVTLAKEISDAVTDSTKSGKSDSWLQQAADDLGVELDDAEIANIKRGPWGSKKSEKMDVRSLREKLKAELDRPVGYRGKYITRGAVNLAHMVSSGKSHEAILGQEQMSALEAFHKYHK